MMNGISEEHQPFTLEERLINEIREELRQARAWPAMNSAHEGYGVLLEEVDELWAHVRTKQNQRNISAMKKEAIQVAAMALRFALDVCNEDVGRR
jgi:head-tail adaptor